jgi:hypothetical protein
MLKHDFKAVGFYQPPGVDAITGEQLLSDDEVVDTNFNLDLGFPHPSDGRKYLKLDTVRAAAAALGYKLVKQKDK